MPDVDVLATDISQSRAGRRTTERRSPERGRSHQFLCTSLLEGVAPGIDLIVSNPPYVPEGYRSGLSSEVRDYEPAEAVFGGRDGFELIRALLGQSAARLAPGGRLLMEFGAGQDDEVACRSSRVHARHDLQGIRGRHPPRRLQGMCPRMSRGQGFVLAGLQPCPAGSPAAPHMEIARMSDCLFCKIASGHIPRPSSVKTKSSSPSTTSTRRRRCTRW